MTDEPTRQYDAGTFRALADTDLGRDLWQFLNLDLIVAAMETATDLGRPAVTGVEEQLLAEFREQMVDDRVKQMVGHMVRQVLEARGYEIERRDVFIGSALFSKGTRYSRSNWQRLHVFRNTRNPRQLCFSARRSASDLPQPESSGNWRFWASFSTVLRGQVAYGIDVPEVRREVSENGYAVRYLERMLRAG